MTPLLAARIASSFRALVLLALGFGSVASAGDAAPPAKLPSWPLSRWIRSRPSEMLSGPSVVGFGTPATPIGTNASPNAPLSPLARRVLMRVQDPQVMKRSTVPAGALLTTGNLFDRALVDGPEIFGGFEELIARAEHEVVVAMYVWEKDSHAARRIGQGLRAALARRTSPGKLFVRILVDDLTLDFKRVINHIYDSKKAWRLDESKVDIRLATFPHAAFGNLHAKYVVVDGKATVVTGANVEIVHDDSKDKWHDTGYLLRGPVARSVLASFDEAWTRHAQHWECKPRRFLRDARKIKMLPLPERPWLRQSPEQPGRTPAILLSRQGRSWFNNDVDNPQDVGYLTVMEGATSHIHIETPNINDDAFQTGVVSACKRGVKVRLLSSKGFNEKTESLPGQGGGNEKNARKMIARLLREDPSALPNLEIRWYSKDGRAPLVGNGPGASHTKFLSVDGAIAIVGSANMDTQAWNNSRELNILLDDPAAVTRIEDAFFAADWQRAVPER